MSHSFLSPTKVIREFMREFQNNISFIGRCKKVTKKDYEIGGMMAGSSINVAVPNNFSVVTANATFAGQDMVERSVAVPVDQQYHVDLNGVTSRELTLTLDDFSQRFIKPAARNLAAKVEQYVINKATIGAGNYVGTPGTTPNSALVYLQAAQKLQEQGAPFGMFSAHINPAANAATVDALKGLFNSQAQVAGQYSKGLMAKDTLGFDFYMNQAISRITCGSRIAAGESTVTNTVSVQGQATIDITGNTTKTYAAGDMFVISSVNWVNPLTKQTLGQAQFCLTEAVTLVAGVKTACKISVPLYTTGGHQNIDAFPQGGATLTFVGVASTAYDRNIALADDSVAFANVELQIPGGVDYAASETQDGISLRIVRAYDISDDTLKTRVDVAFGAAVLRPEWITQIIGA